MGRNQLINNGYEVQLDNVSPMPFFYHAVISTHEGKPLFDSPGNCNILAYLIFEAAVLHKYNLLAFCIMPDHVHILCQPGDIVLYRFLDLLRLRFEYILQKNGHSDAIWRPDFEEHSLTDEEVFTTALFIYQNPARNGLVNDPMEYPFSFVFDGKKYRP